MNVIISIDGREAVPVRALAWLTGWHFSAPEVAEAIAGDLDWPEVVCTQYLDGDAVKPYPVTRWQVSHVIALEEVSNRKLSPNQWQIAATQALPAGVFVWRDEWESAYNQSPDGPDVLAAVAEDADDFADVKDRTLNFDPFVSPELAEVVMAGFAGAPDTQAATAEQAQTTAPVTELEAAGGLPDALVVAASETPKQRRARLLEWFDSYKGGRGAKQRVFEREKLLNPNADRSYICKQIEKAKAEQADKKRGDGWTSQLVEDEKR